MTEEIAQLNMRLAALEAERQAARAGPERAGGAAAGPDRRPGRAGADARPVPGEERRAGAGDRGEGAAAPGHPPGERGAAGAIARINEEKLALEAQRNQADKEARRKTASCFQWSGRSPCWSRRRPPPPWRKKQLLDKLWETYELSHEAARPSGWSWRACPKAQRRVGS